MKFLLFAIAGWTTVNSMASSASAQVKPPGVQDGEGNAYRYPVMTRDEPVVKMHPDASANDRAVRAVEMENTLRATIIPHLVVTGATLSDALEYIRQENRRRVTDPTKSGIGYFVKMPPPSTPPAPPFLISLDLKNTSVMDALQAVAAQAKLKVHVDSFAVSLVPLSENIDPMITAEFLLPPEALGFPHEAGPSPTQTLCDARRDVKDFLESKGITFPPGASAVYLSTPRKLVVRNTYQNIEIMKTVFKPTAPTASIAPKSP